MIKKRQHYVSRYYLKAWACNKERIYCLRENKIFQSNLMGVAQEKYFYELQNLTENEQKIIHFLGIEKSNKMLQEIHLSFLNKYLLIFNIEKELTIKNIYEDDLNKIIEEHKVNFEEDYHSEIESIGIKYIDLIRNKDIDFYYDEKSNDRMMFLFFLTLQYMRTKRRKNQSIRAANNKVNMSKIWPILAHIWATNLSHNLHLDKSFNLILLENKSNLNFITSDQPIVNTYAMNSNELEDNELEFYYPLSPKLAILITKNISDCKKLVITENEKIKEYNEMMNTEKEEQLFAEREAELEQYKEIQMDLFEQKVEDEKLHPNYISLIKYTPKEDRDILNKWIKGFPDRDNKFVKEFQTTFNSCFWEIYLYKLFKELEFSFNWDYDRPDFVLNANGIDFIVEATISSNAQNEIPEWEKKLLEEKYDNYLTTMNDKNMYSIIRLANSFLSKYTKYKSSYYKLEHVKNKPFILAIAPFEQPLHYHQYDRPIMALLYDFYLDEEEYLENPGLFPNGLQDKRLYYVEKENGSQIDLGMFLDERAEEISAVLFNPLATFSKIQHMKEKKSGIFQHIWTTQSSTKPLITDNEEELIEDGLFIFHNPYAKYPLDKSIFNKKRICQVYMNKKTLYIEKDFEDKHLSHRITFEVLIKKDEEESL